MSDATNLDLLLGEPKTVTLAGQDYLLPADLPIPTATRIDELTATITAAEEGDSDEHREGQAKAGEALLQLYGVLLPVFQHHQPELTEVPANATQLVLLVPSVYGGLDLTKQAEGDAAPPTKPKKTPVAGTKSSSRTPAKSRSRSSAS